MYFEFSLFTIQTLDIYQIDSFVNFLSKIPLSGSHEKTIKYPFGAMDARPFEYLIMRMIKIFFWMLSFFFILYLFMECAS